MTATHQIHVGRGGTFESSGDFSTPPADIDELITHFETNNVDAITIHFHGGLVSEEKGVDIAKMMKPVYEAANTYPVSFVWETGLIETLRQNLTRIHKTKLFQKLLKWVIGRAAERFGGFDGKGVGTPIADSAIAAELQKDRPFDDYDDRSTGKGAARGGDIAVTEADLEAIRQDLEAEFEEIIDEDGEIQDLLAEKDGESPADSSQKGIFTAAKLVKALAKITFRVIRRHVKDTDHGFYPTVVEEIVREYYLADLAAWVWGDMKEKAASMWLPNDGLSGEEQHVGYYFLEKLATLSQQHEVRVNLVGHSAGSIVICRMLSASDNFDNITFDNIVFLAPAVRSDVAVQEVARHTSKFSSFSQYTMSDNFERNDALIKGIYTRSLLYLISGILEPDKIDQPIAGMMRHASGKKPHHKAYAKEWADFIHDNDQLVLANSTVLDPDAPPGKRTASETHGGFDEDKLTQESLTAILS